MPELPEVAIVVSELAALRGREIVSAWAFNAENFRDATAAVGSTFATATRVGKWISVPLGDRFLNIHLGMTGRLALHDRAGAHLRASWQLDGATLNLFDPRRFGQVRVSTTPPQLGADAERDDLTGVLTGRARSTKALLLDQRSVAGVGNYLADPSRPAVAVAR